MTTISEPISFRIKKEIKEEFEKYALLSHTTMQEILRGYILDLLNITQEQYHHKTCIVCGNSFQTNNPVRKFCSYECRKKNNLAVRKAWEFKNRAKDEGLLTSSDILKLKKETKCFYCGCELNDSNRTLDHFIPLCKGGANIKENVVACCFGCNNKKGKKTYEEYIKTLKSKS